MSQGLHNQQMFDQSLQQGFDTMGLGDNVFTPTKSRRRTNGLKTGAQSITPYEYGGGQVNPYAQGQGDIFYQPGQNAYMSSMPVGSTPPAISNNSAHDPGSSTTCTTPQLRLIRRNFCHSRRLSTASLCLIICEKSCNEKAKLRFRLCLVSHLRNYGDSDWF
jgi:hypothetical protein